MTKIQKGTEVWMFGEWNGLSTHYAQRLTITSWGKKEATAVKTENGKPLRLQLYTDPTKPWNHLGRIIPVADMPDPTAEGMRRAIEQKAKNIKRIRNTVHNYAISDLRVSNGYFENMKEDCEKVIAEPPTFLIR